MFCNKVQTIGHRPAKQRKIEDLVRKKKRLKIDRIQRMLKQRSPQFNKQSANKQNQDKQQEFPKMFIECLNNGIPWEAHLKFISKTVKALAFQLHCVHKWPNVYQAPPAAVQREG